MCTGVHGVCHGGLILVVAGGGGGTCSAVAEGFTAIPYWMFREILLNERLRRG